MGNDATTEGLLDSVQGLTLSAGQAFRMGLYTAARLSQTQLLALADWLIANAGIDLTDTAQFDRRVTDAVREANQSGPQLGDMELQIAGVPNVGMSAAAAVGWVLRGLAWVGAAAAAWSFTQDPAGVGAGVAEAADAAKWPLLLILLIILALLYAWKKL